MEKGCNNCKILGKMIGKECDFAGMPWSKSKYLENTINMLATVWGQLESRNSSISIW